MGRAKWILVTAIAMTVIACGDDDGLTGPQKDYNDYKEQLEEDDIDSRESYIIGQLQVVAADETDLDQMLAILADVIPRAEILISDLQKVAVRESELRQIHSKLVQAWQLYLRGLRLLQSGLEELDVDDIEAAGELMNEGRTLIDEFSTDVQLYRAGIE